MITPRTAPENTQNSLTSPRTTIMEDLRTGALKVFLQHSLCCALSVYRSPPVLHLRWEAASAFAIWTQYCRSAQKFCTVFGLCAIDRAKCCFRYWLLCDTSFDQVSKDIYQNLAQQFDRSAKCYVSAVNHQLRRDTVTARLWGYIGTVYDQVDGARLDTLRECRNDGQLSPYLRSWTKQAEKFEWSCIELRAEFCVEEIIALTAEITRTYRTAIAQAEVAIALHGLTSAPKRCFNSTAGLAAGAAATCLERSLSYTQDALQCTGEGERELQALWRLCAHYMRCAADQSISREIYHVTRWQYCSSRIGRLGTKIAPVLRSLNEASAAAPDSLELRAVKQLLSRVFQQINESCLVTDPQSDHAYNFNTAVLQEAIEEVEFSLKRVTTRAHELAASQQLLAAAEKVNVDQSPAHTYIKRCWLNAAEHMKLAAESTDNAQCKLHKLRSLLQARLAVGPLATAAHYYAKSDRAATRLAEELCYEAAHTQLAVTIALLERCQGAVELLQIQQVEFTEEEAALVQRARMLAEGALPSPTALATQSGLISNWPLLSAVQAAGAKRTGAKGKHCAVM
jgi:hypothetical protein